MSKWRKLFGKCQLFVKRKKTNVTVSSDPIGDAPGHERPFDRAARVHMAVLSLLSSEKHFRLEFDEFFEEAEAGRVERDHFSVDEFPLSLFLIFALGVPMFFDVPYGVGLIEQAIGDDFVLIESPVGKLSAAEFQSVFSADVDQANLALDRVPEVAVAFSIDDFDAPQILRGHRNVVVDVTRNFLALGRHGGCDVVRIEGTTRDPVDQLNDVSVFQADDRSRNHQIFHFRQLHDPPVVHVLEGVTRDLLLMGTSSRVSVSQRVNVVVAVQPTSSTVRVPQSYLGAVSHFQRLALRYARETTLQTRLERARHHGIVRPCLRQHRQMHVKDTQINESKNQDYYEQPQHQMHPEDSGR